VNIQRLVGSQRALKSVEDFTEIELRAAYFDGDPVIATNKGVNILERGSQVHAMAEFQQILGFPPAPKLGIDGKIDPSHRVVIHFAVNTGRTTESLSATNLRGRAFPSSRQER
jgi:hypothetical protein